MVNSIISLCNVKYCCRIFQTQTCTSDTYWLILECISADGHGTPVNSLNTCTNVKKYKPLRTSINLFYTLHSIPWQCSSCGTFSSNQRTGFLSTCHRYRSFRWDLSSSPARRVCSRPRASPGCVAQQRLIQRYMLKPKDIRYSIHRLSQKEKDKDYNL